MRIEIVELPNGEYELRFGRTLNDGTAFYYGSKKLTIDVYTKIIKLAFGKIDVGSDKESR